MTATSQHQIILQSRIYLDILQNGEDQGNYPSKYFVSKQYTAMKKGGR